VSIVGGYMIKDNYVMAETVEKAQEAYDNDELLYEEWDIVNDDMSIEDVVISEIIE
jgi:hypothetical protein